MKMPSQQAVQGAAVHAKEVGEMTRELPPFGYDIPTSMTEILTRGGSAAGNSAVQAYLSCPEYSRLRSMGVTRKRRTCVIDGIPDELDYLDYGSLMHALMAVRVVYGYEVAESLLDKDTGPLELCAADRLKAFHLLKTYDQTYPLNQEPFDYLGIEVEVVSDVSTIIDLARGFKGYHDGTMPPTLRTVRYDHLVRFRDDPERGIIDDGIYSLETKTAARAGQMQQYLVQFAVQIAIWNSNSQLVEQYGRMRGVIPNQLVKTEVPKCERLAPVYGSSRLERLAADYLSLPDRIEYPMAFDGAYARMLHSCWGKYRPCQYIGLCWENSQGDYESR